MNMLSRQSILFLAAVLGTAIPAAWGAEYKIVHKTSAMNVEFAYTEAAATSAGKNGKTLQDAINRLSPFLFMTLLQAAKGGEAFQGYVINRVYEDEGNALDIVAVISRGQVLAVAESQNPVIQTLFENLKNARLFGGDSPAVELSPSQDRAVKVALAKR